METRTDRAATEEGKPGSAQLWTRLRAVLAGGAVFAGVFFLRRQGVLNGIPALVFASLIVGLMPWSTSLSRRVLLGGAIFIGWVPLLWWLRLPVPQVDRMGILLAVASAALVAWVLWGPGVRTRAKRVLPQLEAVDAILFIGIAVTAWTVWPLLGSASGIDSLNILSGMGSDHAAHSAMAMQARGYGAIAPMLGPAPDGSGWAWENYPQNFHASIAALTEVYAGPRLGDAAKEIWRYGVSLALMQVLTAALLSAGVAQLPSLRRRPLFAWPVAAMVGAAFVFGTGSWALKMGYENFIWACAAAGIAVLVGASMSRELPLLSMFCLGGLVVASVHGWTLMAPLTVAGACLALVPWKGPWRPESRRGWVVFALVIAATAAACFAVVPILLRGGGEAILVTQAEWVPHGPSAIAQLVLSTGMALAAGLAVYARGRAGEMAAKGFAVAAIPALGLLLLVALGAYQYATIGELSYFFDKWVWGLGLVSVVVLAAGLALHVGSPPASRGTRRKMVAIVAAAAATVGALQLFGLEGIEYRVWAEERTSASPPAAGRILEATDVAKRLPFASAVYLAAMPEDIDPFYSEAYLRGLNLMFSRTSERSNAILREIDYSDGADIGEAATAAQKLLQLSPDITVVVAPEIITELRERLPEEVRGRVVTWQ